MISVYGSLIVAGQLNELLLGNFSSVNLEVFTEFIIIAGIAFTCFIFPLNYILLRNSKPEEKFIKPKYLVPLFIIHILLVYATVYVSIAFFYVITYGVFMPPEIYYIFNNNVINLKEYQLIHAQSYVTGIFCVSIILLTYTLYSLFCAYEIKKGFFNLSYSQIINKMSSHFEVEKNETKTGESRYRSLIEKMFNYKMAEIYYRSFIYYFSAIWIIEPVIITFVVLRDTISKEFLTVVLTMNDRFTITFFLLNIIFIFIPAYIFSNLREIYGFNITTFLNKNKIDKGIDFYCKYLSIITSLFITLNIYGIYHILEEYGNIVPNTNAKAALSLIVIYATNYAFSKPRELLSVFLKYIIYES
ncbi:hypothetical protein [Methanosarcina sp. DH2]|uniref:hypothetical protein n=1 Tax=Methanosarcina sp. DH2 TaxID=2605639 RepID=UPI001E303F19|nr:hypothetical protein [Methanosarcina sp. DH2]